MPTHAHDGRHIPRIPPRDSYRRRSAYEADRQAAAELDAIELHHKVIDLRRENTQLRADLATMRQRWAKAKRIVRKLKGLTATIHNHNLNGSHT